jgi:hypothetical protein
MVRDWRLGNIHPTGPVHEGGRSKRRLAWKAGLDEYARFRVDGMAVSRGKLREEIVRMLPVDKRSAPVGRFASPEQQRIAVRAHERIGRQHRAQAEGAVAQRPLRRCHHHAADEGLVAASGAALVVVSEVDQRVPHRAPVAEHSVDTFMRSGVRQPARPRAFPGHVVGTEKALDAMTGVTRVTCHLMMGVTAVSGVIGMLRSRPPAGLA